MSVSIDFVGVGAARSGTTWISSCLSQHPDIFIPPRKELHYFSNDLKYQKDLENFSKYFEGSKPGQKLGEFTPRYSIRPLALQRIKSHFPDVKILYIIREPVARSYSQYLFFRFNKAKENIADFELALEGPYREDYIDKSLYSRQLVYLHELFKAENIKVLLFEEILSNPEYYFAEIFRFMGVNDDFLPDFGLAGKNESIQINSSTFLLLKKIAIKLNARYRSSKNPVFHYFAGIINTFNRFIIDSFGSKQILMPDIKLKIQDKYFKEDMKILKNDFRLNIERWEIQ